MHIKRIITAVLILPLVVLSILYLPFYLFGVFIGFVVILASIEFFKMTEPSTEVFDTLFSLFLYLIIPVGFLINQPAYALTVSTVCFILFYSFQNKEKKLLFQRLSVKIFGLIYVSFFISHLIPIMNLQNGRKLIFVTLIIVSFGDTLAFYFGTFFGKHKLCQKISPKKSIEGAIGSYIGSFTGLIVAKFTYFQFLTYGDIFFLTMFVGTLGQLGDLVESFLKSNFEVKDSGTLLPGHGGILDRIDSLIFAAPSLYYYMLFKAYV